MTREGTATAGSEVVGAGAAGSGVVAVPPATWDEAREALRSRGLRWTPQRRLIVDVLAETTGHVTGSEVVDRCLARDQATIASTVYRTLDVLEELGYVHHSHGVDGREEYHVLPAVEHGHLFCTGCGGSWEILPEEAAGLVERLRDARGFTVQLGHLAIQGRCRDCGSESGT